MIVETKETHSHNQSIIDKIIFVSRNYVTNLNMRCLQLKNVTRLKILW